MKKLTKFVAVLLLLAVVVSGLYIISGVQVKSSIKEELQPLIEDLQSASNAKSVDIKICTEPDSYDLPWQVKFNVFLTANVDDLRRLTDADALDILNNGVELGEKALRYGYELRNYAVYTRKVTDSVTGVTHPVFVTLSDGDRSYSLTIDTLFQENMLYKQDAYKTLHPPVMNRLMLISILASVVLLCILGFFVFKNAQKSAQLKKANGTPETESTETAENSPATDTDSINRHIDESIAKAKEAKQKEHQKKAVKIAVACAAAAAVCAASVVCFVAVPANQYRKADTLLNAGDIDGAYAIFEKLGGFKDAQDRRNEIDYFRADSFLTSHEWQKAYLLLNDISGYKDSAEILRQLVSERPYLSILSAAKGDTVTLGEYEQDNDTANGPEPIKWIVLYNENGEVYLLSKYVLDAQPFNTANLKECSLDDWLKTEFSATAFASVNDDIITRTGILQEIDIKNYGMTPEQIKAEYTAYAKAQDPESGYASGLMWWVIEDTLSSSGGHVNAPVVWENGNYGNYVCTVTKHCGVRPAVWLFADADNIPSEPVFDGSAPIQWRSGRNTDSTGKNICSRCSGTGRVTKHFGNSWNSIPGYGYGDVCGACGGTGYN